MKFKGAGLVWDKENNKPLVKFENGEAVVKDKRAQEVLLKLDYEVLEEDEPVDLRELPVSKLKKISKDDIITFLKEEGIEFDPEANKDDLIKLIVDDEE